MIFQRFLVTLCIAAVLSGGPARSAQASEQRFALTQDSLGAGQPSEFVFKNDLDETLIPIFLIGAVTKPGLYHVPAHTDLVTLLALSGGTVPNADLSQIVLKHPKLVEATEVDLEVALKGKDFKGPVLSSNDVILVKMKEPWISSNAVATIGFVTGLLSIVLSSLVISQQLNK